jgi:hypothetical protein
MTDPVTSAELAELRVGLASPGCQIPAYMHNPLTDYVVAGKHPGGFLTAVLENDLLRAVTCADPDNFAAIREWVRLLHNYLPRRCYGSASAVENWAQRKD